MLCKITQRFSAKTAVTTYSFCRSVGTFSSAITNYVRVLPFLSLLSNQYTCLPLAHSFQHHLPICLISSVYLLATRPPDPPPAAAFSPHQTLSFLQQQEISSTVAIQDGQKKIAPFQTLLPSCFSCFLLPVPIGRCSGICFQRSKSWQETAG